MTNRMKLTKAQDALLARLRETDGIYVVGPEVRAAQSLVKLGFASLRDDGSGSKNGSNFMHERWFLTITDAGRGARVMVSFRDPDGLPRAWAVADTEALATPEAERQLGLYRERKREEDDSYLANAKYTKHVETVGNS